LLPNINYPFKMKTMNYLEFINQYANHPHYHAPTGNVLNAKSWQTEAPLRMLLNNLNAAVAEDPTNLVVYGGTGQAARNTEAVKDIIRVLLSLDEHHSLLVQSGKPIGLVRSHPQAPRVLIANSNLVPAWATWSHFEDLRARGLIMYGQMTAGSWIYIGSQGILQGTYETFVECGKKYFNGQLKHKLIVSGGMGGMGGAQPLAATMAGATFLGVDVDEQRIKKRLDTRYIDKMTHNYHEAILWVMEAKQKGEAISVGLVGNIVDVLQMLINDNIIPDIVTDQTSAHDPLNGYVPHGISLNEAIELRHSNPQLYQQMALASMAHHVGFILEMQKRGSIAFDYGNNLREFAKQGGQQNAYNYNGFIPEFIRPLFCDGKGPFRWVALSGDPQDIFTTDKALMEAFPQNEHLTKWLTAAQKRVDFQGLPSRICWLGMGEREKAGLIFNQLVRDGKVKAPIVIGRDHLDCGSVASPNRETEAMMDGSDAVSDWPLLNLMANTAGGATWVSFHHGGGVGIGYSQHAGMVVVADGSSNADDCLRRVLHNDPAMGIYRHADAGYAAAIDNREKFNLNFYK
jgi:urocanate hydratase